MKRVVIVGGGITGLATAFGVVEAAAAQGVDVEVAVLEGSSSPGGNIRTDRVDGYTIERGPNGFLDNAPKTLELAHRLGLEDRLRKADEAAARRFIYRGGRLHPAPTGPVSFLRSPLLSLRGRLRVLAEPFARRRPEGVDETVYDFAARRIGPEAASVLVDAMVSGVFAGDVHSLSLRSSFPKMHAMESEHGGLVRAMVARMRERRGAREDADRPAPGGPAGPSGRLTSFEDGLDTWIGGLVSALEERGVGVRTGARVASIERRPSTDVGDVRDMGDVGVPGDSGSAASSGVRAPSSLEASSAWRLELDSGEVLTADAVVLAIPATRAAPLLEPLDPGLAGAVGEIPTAGLSVVALGYDAASLADVDVRGFGFLVPRGEGLRILGCLWDSSIFPGRAPDGKVLLRAMIGGPHDPAAVSDDDDVLLGHVRRDLESAMGLTADPELTGVYRWPLGIGQYTVGHQARLDRIHERLAHHPGLHVAGSSYYGVSMNACIEKAAEMGAEIVEGLAGRGSEGFA